MKYWFTNCFMGLREVDLAEMTNGSLVLRLIPTKFQTTLHGGGVPFLPLPHFCKGQVSQTLVSKGSSCQFPVVRSRLKHIRVEPASSSQVTYLLDFFRKSSTASISSETSSVTVLKKQLAGIQFPSLSLSLTLKHSWAMSLSSGSISARLSLC